MASGKRRSKRRTPVTTQELEELYRTPDHLETPGTQRRRKGSRKKARQTFIARAERDVMRTLCMDGVIATDANEIDDVMRRLDMTGVDEETKVSEEYEERKEEVDSDHEVQVGGVVRHLRRNSPMEVSVLSADFDELSIGENDEPQQSRLQERRGLCNHENYDESKLKGKFIVDGRHVLPDQVVVCSFCKALKWKSETPKCCCTGGAIQLVPLSCPPPAITNLLQNDHFKTNIRAYNSAFAFTSIGANLAEPLRLDRTLANATNGVYTFRIQGQVCHRIGTLLPLEGHQPAFAQVYVFDTNEEAQTNRRMEIFSDLNRSIVEKIGGVLRGINPYAQRFLMAGEFAKQSRPVALAIRDDAPNIDIRTHNRPTASDVAVLIADNEKAGDRDIVLHMREGGLFRIQEFHAGYDPLQYPLLFPYGDFGWSLHAKYREGVTKNRTTKMSPREYAAYRLYERADEYSWIHRSGRLFQQYIVDQYAKIETQRLKWQRNNQKEIRADLYCGIEDAAMTEMNGNLHELGKRVILPPSFTGGERYMRQQYQDAMAIVRQFGKPDLFITVTCNPKWPEITKQLHTGQKAEDRPDIVVRVFRLKLKAILDDLFNKHVLGVVVARVHVIEFQKRGLPHAHILIILRDEDKPRSPTDYDLFVSAEIPDPVKHPKLHETVCRSMVHGPCGALNRNAPCMKDGVCSKGFPKSFSEETRNDGDGYPQYRRRDDGRKVSVKGELLDNRFIVPYNPFLLHKYNCHINVEVCSTIASVKYLYKYVYKGHDRATITINSHENRDEIDQFVNARYISASESCWRIFEYSLQGKSHTVVKLPVHLPQAQMVYYRGSELADEVLARSANTKLTKFFELCQVDVFAATLVYHELPCFYTWCQPQKQWNRRKRDDDKTVGRMMSCSPMDIERYHLRILLCYVKGPTSFEHLRTVHGHTYATFKQAAAAAGYLEDDREWDKCLQEASTFRMPAQLRQLFAIILCYCQPADTKTLWEKYFSSMAEDFLRDFNELEQLSDEAIRIIQVKVLQDINAALLSNSKTLEDFPMLPQLRDFNDLADEVDETEGNRLLRSERSYKREELQTIISARPLLNREQRIFFDKVMHAVASADASQRYFFIDGPGGTGKSFLLAQILASVRVNGDIALAVASSGIASLLLMGGRTAHSRFKLPLNLTEHSHCHITKQSATAKLLRKAKIIVWDEAPMMHRYAIEAVDRTLQDLMGNNHLFGSKVIVLAGDFRQVLPVVPRASDAQIVAACLNNSNVWRKFEKLRLRENMRVQTARHRSHAEEIQEFAEFLLKIGEGRHDTCTQCGAEHVTLPADILIPTQIEGPSKLERLIHAVYGDILNNYGNADYLADRVLLTPKNAEVKEINFQVLQRLPGEPRHYLSVDSIEDNEQRQRNLYPVEFLNTLTLTGMPPHKLSLAIGAPIILLRNIQGEQGLCNGTRLIVRDLKRNCIDAMIITGAHKGRRVFIPRITLISQNANLPFQLRRRQFPIQLAYAMTINKAQGQSVHHLGLYLPQPVFTHGQLYVALSRVTSRKTIKIAVEDAQMPLHQGVCTRNIVFNKIFKK